MKEYKGTVGTGSRDLWWTSSSPGMRCPPSRTALWLEVGGQKRVMEVAQHIGGDTVRCFMLSPSEGIGRGMEVKPWGGPHLRPGGGGRVGPDVQCAGGSHRRQGSQYPPRSTGPSTASPPALPTSARWWTCLRQGSRSSTCWPPMPGRQDRPVWRRWRGQNGADPRS